MDHKMLYVGEILYSKMDYAKKWTLSSPQPLSWAKKCEIQNRHCNDNESEREKNQDRELCVCALIWIIWRTFERLTVHKISITTQQCSHLAWKTQFLCVMLPIWWCSSGNTQIVALWLFTSANQPKIKHVQNGKDWVWGFYKTIFARSLNKTGCVKTHQPCKSSWESNSKKIYRS